MLKLNHKNLNVWKVSKELIKMLYQITEKFPGKEQFVLSSQIKRAAISVSSNIAEGASRTSAAERKRFYTVARSSLVEIDTQIEIADMLDYINKDEIEKIDELINHTFALLTNLIKNSK